MSEDTAVCFMCETNDATLETAHNSEPICNDCAWSCDACEEIGTENDNWWSVDGERWCENCIDDASYCERCCEYSSDGGYYIADRGVNWCDGCTSYHGNWCDECEHYTEDNCESCNGDTQDGVRIVHDYNYRPDPVFHTIKDNERLFFGVELEMEFPNGYRGDASSHAYHALEPDDYAYLKNDGSLEEGFELVTHPMSFDFLMDNEASEELWDTIEKLRTQYEARSYNTRTCGFHIHISRTGFNGGAHMHRFLNLVYSNPEFYSKLAGRKSDQWAKFDDVYRSHYDPATEKYQVVKALKDKLTFDPRFGNDTDRYSAINTRNRHTLEMRIFKGTLSRTALMAHIQLAHASVEYTRNLSLSDVKSGALGASRFVEFIINNNHDYPDLLARLEHKQLLSPRVEQVRLADPSNYNYDRETNLFFQRERERRWREEEERQERERAERRDNPTEEVTISQLYNEALRASYEQAMRDMYGISTEAATIRTENN